MVIWMYMQHLEWGVLVTNNLYRNNGDGTFTDVSATIGFSTANGDSFGTALGDYNSDGYYDILVSNTTGDKIALWKNSGGINNWMKVHLTGTNSNINGIGAWINVYTNGQKQVRYTTVGSSYSSQDSFNYIFGLNNSISIDSLVIEWDRGTINKAYNLSANQTLEIEETLAPSDFLCDINEEENIELNWSDNSDNESGFLLERSLEANDNFVEISTLPISSITYEDMTTEELTTYYYRLYTVNSYLSSSYVSASASTPLKSPSNLTVSTTSFDVVELTWQDNSAKESNYIIERSLGNTDNFEVIATLDANVTSYQDNSFTDGFDNTYFYRVKAIQGEHNSGYSTNASTIVSSILHDEYWENIKVYPNPANDFVKISFDNTDRGKVKITLFDKNGKVIDVWDNVKEENNFQETLNITNLNNGIYFLEISLGKQKYVKKIYKN